MNDPNNGTDESLVKNISCFGNRDGEIMVNLSNSSSGLSYIYSWSGPSGYTNTTSSNHIKNLHSLYQRKKKKYLLLGKAFYYP